MNRWLHRSVAFLLFLVPFAGWVLAPGYLAVVKKREP